MFDADSPCGRKNPQHTVPEAWSYTPAITLETAMDGPGEITQLLEAHARGDRDAFARLYESVYEELRRLARGQRRRLPGAGQTLDTTALVHEAYLKLVGGEARAGCNRGHFLAVAASAMRHILVDHGRAVSRAKRGGDRERTTLEPGSLAVEWQAEEILAVDRALEKLATVEPRLVRVVECRHFLGLTEAETAEALGSSLRTVQRDFRAASVWLKRELGQAPAGESRP